MQTPAHVTLRYIVHKPFPSTSDVVDFGNPVQPFPNYYSLGRNIRWFAEHGVRGVFEEGAGVQAGGGTDLIEMKAYVMAEMLWDPYRRDPDQLITEFLVGYYSPAAAPFLRLYIDTMHSSVNATKTFLLADACSFGKACKMEHLGVVNCRGFLTPLALLESARAFSSAVTALNHSSATKDTIAIYLKRVERASMSVLYNVLWRWTEVRQYARSHSIPWPLSATQQEGFARFAAIYNASSSQDLSNLAGPGKRAGLHWFHNCIFATVAKPDPGCKC